jgi:protein TonB
MAPEQPPAKKASPSQITRVSEISQTVVPVERKIVPLQSTVESVQPIDQKREAPQLREAPTEQRVEVTEPKVAPALDSKESEPVAVAGSQEPVEAQAVQREAAAGSSVLTSSPEIPLAQETSLQTSSPTDGVDAPAIQMAKASASDHRWLAESLWRRVAELKRYPNSARMNGQEGKVILKAVIRSDGQLADVSVQKSSGYHVLDEAAIEAVKLACPLQMKHAIGKPQIVVSLPIVYSLAH